MDERKSSAVPEWRAFEELVARIESAAAPRDATVTSPDHIPDKRTGKKREVDASIRLTVGTVPVLITIECRKRKSVQDVTWIEQLAKKRLNLGASQTIAVASSGFSKEAENEARLSGIVLRQIKEVSAADVESWLAPKFLVHLFKQSRLLENPGLEYVLTDDDRLDGASPPEIENADFNAKILVNKEGAALSFNDIWSRIQAQKDPYDLIPNYEAEDAPDGKGPPIPNVKIEIRMELDISRGDLQLQTTQGLRDVGKIKMLMEIWYEQENVPLDEAVFHLYTEPDGIEVQRTEISLTAKNLDMKLAFQGEKGGKDVTFEAAVQLNKPSPE